MSVTKRGTRWEVLHSLWIGWTFTLSFFNWIAFLYIGLRVDRKRWLLWGVFYSVPFILAMSLPDLNGWPGDLVVALTFIMGVMGIIHAFWIRKDYLSRLARLHEAKRHLENNYHEYSEARWQDQLPDETTHPKIVEGSASSLPDATEIENKDDIRDSSKSVTSAEPPRDTKPKAERKNASVAERFTQKQDSEQTVNENQLRSLISTSYPFPLAFGVRSLSSIVDSRDLYREQLRIAENMLAFLASVSLSLLHDGEYKEMEIVELEQFWRSGISPGDWKEIIGRCSKAFAASEASLAASIHRLNIRSEKKGFGANIAYLIRAKNDYKHDRGPKILEDFKEATSETQQRLHDCMRDLRFFTEYPIRQVEDFDLTRDGEKFFLKCLRYVGDHPSFHQEEVEFHKAVPRGDLLIDLGNQKWMSLYPFITTMNCPHCKVRETYFIDMWDQRRSVAKMKSFERGHTEDNTEVSETLSEING